MAAGKWIHDIGPATPLVDAARHVLTLRLEVVRDNLDLALKEPDKDPEHVHQLRVGARRAGAALAIFSSCLPRSHYRRARKQIRCLRQAAGNARDWDVFLLVLEAEKGRAMPRQRAGLDLLLGYALGHRAVAQDSLVEASPDHPFAIERLVAETLAAVRRPHEDRSRQELHSLAWPLLSSFLSDLNEAGQDTANDPAGLHRMRITGKRLRYAMEVLGECFAPPLRLAVYPVVEEMQEILGRINDSNVARQCLQALATQLQARFKLEWKRWRLGIDHLLRLHEKQLQEDCAQFLAWREKWQTLGNYAHWQSLLLEPRGGVSPHLGDRVSMAGKSSEGPGSPSLPAGVPLVGNTGAGDEPVGGGPNGIGEGAEGAPPGNPPAGTAAGETLGSPT